MEYALGAVVIGREAYLEKLAKALGGPDVFDAAHESDSLW